MNSLSPSGPRPAPVVSTAVRGAETREAAAPTVDPAAGPGAAAAVTASPGAAVPTEGVPAGVRRTISADEVRSSRARGLSGEQQALARLFGASLLLGRGGADDVLDALGRRPRPRPRPTGSTTTMAERPPLSPQLLPAPTTGQVQRAGGAGVASIPASCPDPGAPTGPAAAEAARPRATSAGGPVDDSVPVGGPLLSLGTPVTGPGQGLGPKRPSRPTGSTSHLKR
jgi:hypothetical protein